MKDDDLFARYEARGIPTDWQELTPEAMAPSFRLFFRALPSPSTEYAGADEAELLIHDPLAALREAGIVPYDETPHISTMVVNHEKTLRRYIMYASVVVSNNPESVGLTIVKEEEEEGD